MQLEGRVALVTGGAKRVGRAIALRLAAAGVRVAVHYRRSREEAERTAAECAARGVEAAAFEADLADPAAPAMLIAAVLARFGRLDILVNNASEFEAMSLDDFSRDAWLRTLEVNLTAPLALAFEAREALRRAKGRVINLCDAATGRPYPSHLAYLVSKGGLDALTRALARALAPEVNVVGLAPGVVAWPEGFDEALRDRVLKNTPLGRAGTPEDVAEAAYFVLAHGDYLTGVILPIDGGRSIA
jgi:pteridine reductase